MSFGNVLFTAKSKEPNLYTLQKQHFIVKGDVSPFSVSAVYPYVIISIHFFPK
ncbi:hypothetical protein BSM4216_1940 [Bacillus smithii]|nr:hypothetical protein BSM4216_1940 [Bacillus smithii]